MRCTRPLISKDNFLNNLSFKQHKLLYCREQRHKTAILQNLPLSRIPEPSNIHWTASSRTAPPSCPTRRNPQAATPEKCFLLKFRCRFTSLSLTAMPVGTILCSIPSRATMKSLQVHLRTKWDSATPLSLQ